MAGTPPPAGDRHGRVLWTVGHGTLDADELGALLTGAEVVSVVDVRRFPGSRRHPHVRREALQQWLPAAGVAYRWEERLGGRRSGHPHSPHTGLRNAAFRAYADHMETREFRAALADVLAEAGEHRTAVMCSETLWWRCHRRLLADAAVLLHDAEVRHLLHDGRALPHELTDAARRDGDWVVYDGGAATLL